MYYLSLRPMYQSFCNSGIIPPHVLGGPLYKINDTCANLIFKFYPYYCLYLYSDFHHILMMYNTSPPEFLPNFVSSSIHCPNSFNLQFHKFQTQPSLYPDQIFHFQYLKEKTCLLWSWHIASMLDCPTLSATAIPFKTCLLGKSRQFSCSFLLSSTSLDLFSPSQQVSHSSFLTV